MKKNNWIQNESKDMNPRISIIVPIYNVAIYLPRCIDSIINQTFEGWELILVDDGSPDNSGTICDKYASMDKRIHVIHKSNGGVSAARNDGMAMAKGEWITFIDGDDFISTTFIEQLYEPIETDSTLTFVHGGCVNYYDDGHTTTNQKYELYVGNDKSLVFGNFRGLIISKLFNKHILQEKKIRFDERIKIAEDYIFTLEYLFHIDRYAFVDCTGYYYYMRRDSATKNSFHYNPSVLTTIEKRIELTERYISSYSLQDPSIIIRRSISANSAISTIFQLYTAGLSIKDRYSIIHNNLTTCTKDYIIKHSTLEDSVIILLRLLFNKFTFIIGDSLITITRSIKHAWNRKSDT